MEWPQITIIVLWAIALTLSIIKHGEPKEEKHSMWMQLLSIIIVGTILHFGGFWS